MDLIEDRKFGRIGVEEADLLLDDAVPLAIRMQERAGLDFVSDGEWRRESYVKVFAEAVGGFENDLIRDHSSSISSIAISRPSCRSLGRCGPSRPAKPSFLREAYESPHAGRRAVALYAGKEDVELRPLHGGLRDPRGVHGGVHPDRQSGRCRRCSVLAWTPCRSTTPGWGCSSILYTASGTVSRTSTTRSSSRSGESTAATEGIDQTPLSVHFCHAHFNRAHGTTGPYDLIMEALGEMKVRRFAMELATPDAGGLDSLRRFPEDKVLGLGVIDHTDIHVETPQEVAARAQRAMEYVSDGADQPQPGLRLRPVERQPDGPRRGLPEAVGDVPRS